MANDLSINVGGTWKAIDNCEINVGGVWKQVDSVKINVGGTWKLVWENSTVTLPADGVTFHEFSATDNPTWAGTWLDTDGTFYSYNADGTLNSEGTWFTGYDPTTELWVRCTHNSGTAPSGDATGSWLQCSVDRDWYIQDTNGSGSAVDSSWTLEISTSATGTPVVDSVTYTPQANYSTV